MYSKSAVDIIHSDATEVMVRRESARGSYLPSCFLHGQGSVTHVIDQTAKVSVMY